MEESRVKPLKLKEVNDMKKQSNQEEKEQSMEKEVDLRVEELEEVIAPRLAGNHNETLVSDTTP